MDNATVLDPFSYAFTRQNQPIVAENYNSSNTEGSIHADEVERDGSLVEIQSVGGLPPGSAEGLTAR